MQAKSGSMQQLVDLNQALISDWRRPNAAQGLGDQAAGWLCRSHLPQPRATLMELIREADIVIGCVAWMTHPGILAALASCNGVGIVVQKEDFLRPDAELVASSPKFDPVRCVGTPNRPNATGPRSHHKFVVFCWYSEQHDCWSVSDQFPECSCIRHFEPYAVWTGSFNFTRNSTLSFENSLVLRHPAIVNPYCQQLGQIAALSEPLDWDSPWIEPEWRIGTWQPTTGARTPTRADKMQCQVCATDVADDLDNSGVQITGDIYAHLYPQARRAAADRMGAWLESAAVWRC
jgi:hypothetical protein